VREDVENVIFGYSNGVEILQDFPYRSSRSCAILVEIILFMKDVSGSTIMKIKAIYRSFTLLLTEFGEFLLLHIIRGKVSNEIEKGPARDGAEVQVMREKLSQAGYLRYSLRKFLAYTKGRFRKFASKLRQWYLPAAGRREKYSSAMFAQPQVIMNESTSSDDACGYTIATSPGAYL
jgi:hypothetical protein